jgi:lipopolysaccharide/colanic/teichoic acid biosynthesis glycosyltransferase
MEFVIIRSPLVYGPGVKGNFASLIRLVDSGFPVPLGAIDNKRSLISVDNLVNFIETCIHHPAAANQTFLVSDGEDLSTTDLLRRLSVAMGKPARLIPVPASVLSFIAKVLGKEAMARRVLGSLQVDMSKARNMLGWEPFVSVDDGLKRCVESRTQVVGNSAQYLMRFCDILFSAAGLLVGLPLFVGIIILGWFDTGSPLFFQERVGRQKKPFILVKFRTMKLDTASVASHLASTSSITKLGSFLRRTKLDELPQLWNVLKGEMSLVGPRPCLFNQDELIREREERGIFAVRPGITGLAQVNEIDMSTPELLAKTDLEMVQTMSLKNYFRYIFMTISGKGSGDRIKK